jgi:hypothetical protein
MVRGEVKGNVMRERGQEIRYGEELFLIVRQFRDDKGCHLEMTERRSQANELQDGCPVSSQRSLISLIRPALDIHVRSVCLDEKLAGWARLEAAVRDKNIF